MHNYTGILTKINRACAARRFQFEGAYRLCADRQPGTIKRILRVKSSRCIGIHRNKPGIDGDELRKIGETPHDSGADRAVPPEAGDDGCGRKLGMDFEHLPMS